VDRHTVTIEPALPLSRALPREQAFEHAAQAFAQRLEPQIRQSPGSWFGWQDASDARVGIRDHVKVGAAQ
jgi:predicted LPLAT superfamily acyltransferase